MTEKQVSREELYKEEEEKRPEFSLLHRCLRRFARILRAEDQKCVILSILYETTSSPWWSSRPTAGSARTTFIPVS